MRPSTVAASALAAVVSLLLGLSAGYWILERPVDLAASATDSSLSRPPMATHPASETDRGFLYGRITTTDGETFEGRLRWGVDEEAFWGDYFNGFKDENPWSRHAPPGQFNERRPIEIAGIEIGSREHRTPLGRPFMGRFGDIARIEARDRDVRVTLKSGTVFDLDRLSADDLADGVRVWDDTHGVLDFGERRIRTIEFLSTPSPRAAPYRLHGTVRTRQGDFTGFVQWNRNEGVGTDELDGHTPHGPLSLRFGSIRSIERNSSGNAVVTLLDGREFVLTGTPEVGHGNLGTYVDDRRYGRVLISWSALERVDFSPGGSGPAYEDFPQGRPLTGGITTRSGRRLPGRLVYDLDESMTTETLDAPSGGVDYTIPFGLIASIVLPGIDNPGARSATVTLHDGEQLRLERAGDLGEKNLGMLVFVEGRARPNYVPWPDVARVDFE